MSRTFIFLVVAVLLSGGAFLARIFEQRDRTADEWNRQVALARNQAEAIRRNTVIARDQPVRNGENFASALGKLGLSQEEARSATSAARRAFDLRQLRAGNTLTVGRSLEGQLREIDYRIDSDRILKILPESPDYSAQVTEIPSRVEVVAVRGTVEDSLFRAIEMAGESAELAMRMAQIFGYDLDFYTDPRRGDSFSIVLEKKRYANGLTAGYGKIFAAEYNNAGRSYQALLYHDAGGHPGYYRQDGQSLQKAFLRSPLKFAAPVSSHFSQSRFHPILKVYRAHLGTDYAAPVGTPVQAIGSGRVTFAGRKGGEGNAIEIAHAGGYQTMYLHLSRILVRRGEPVEIGRTIGLVGTTGLATGPHLDFRILERGQYRNFEKLGLPPSAPVAKRDFAEFAALCERWLPVLKNPGLLRAATAGAFASAP